MASSLTFPSWCQESRGLCRGLVIPVSQTGRWELCLQPAAIPGREPPRQPPGCPQPRSGSRVHSGLFTLLVEAQLPPFFSFINDISIVLLSSESEVPQAGLSTSKERLFPASHKPRGSSCPSFSRAHVQLVRNAGGPTTNTPGPQAFARHPPSAGLQVPQLHLAGLQLPPTMLLSSAPVLDITAGGPSCINQVTPSCRPLRGSL